MRHMQHLFMIVLAILPFIPDGTAHAAAPNVVLIISDDQAWTDYGFMEHPDIKTPNLDQLAAESATFRHGYVPTALCRPSLVTLLTGHYASVHGVTGNDPSPKHAKKGSDIYRQRCAQLISYLDKFETVPEALGKLGYVSHQSGKLWEGSYQHCGFTHGMTRGFPEPDGRHGDDGLKIGREGMQPIEEFVDLAVAEQKPFFVWYAPFLPHSPHNPPPRLLKRYQSPDRPEPIAKYYAMCDWFDETCGQLLKTIDAKGIRENTLVIYVTDNGWIQSPNKRGYAPRSKQTPYEGGIRTPITFRWPEKFAASERAELVSSIDIVPTILGAVGAPIPDELPGLNLLPSLVDHSPLQRDTIFGESFAHDIADIENPEASLLFRWCIEAKPGSDQMWKLLLTYDGEVNRYASTHPRTERRPQLFELKADSHEKFDIAASNPDVVARLVEKINAWYPVKQRTALTTVE